MKINRLILLLGLLIAPCLAFADTWVPTPPALIPGTTTPASVVFPTYSPSLGEYLVTWQTAGGQPMYDLFNGTTWGVPTSIPTAAHAASGVLSSFSPTLGVFLVTWTNPVPFVPTYITFNGVTWSASAAIPGAVSGGVSVFSSFGRGVFLVTWRTNVGGLPEYATFNGITWTTPATIPGSVIVAANSAVMSSYNVALGEFVVTWRDSATNRPFFALFNGTTWTTPTAIPGSIALNAGPVFAVPTAYSSLSGQTMAVWTDAATPHPFYSLFNGTSWTTPAALPLGSGTNGTAIYVSFDAISQRFLATWESTSTAHPIYSTFDGTTWSTPIAIPLSSTMTGASFSAAGFNQFLVTWLGNPPLRLIYDTLVPSPAPFPISIVGTARQNRSVLQTEFFNVIQWTAPTGVLWTPAFYQVYRNAALTDLAATVPASGPLEFVDHNVAKGVAYTYYIVAVDTMGNSHFLASVTVVAGSGT
jgi:hypothetical protein